MKNLKLFIVCATLLCGAVIYVHATNQEQPSILVTPVQYSPINSYTTAAGSASASVTITGVANQRVRLYHVSVWCGGAPGTGIVPGLGVADGGTTVFSSPGGQDYSNGVYPVGKYSWLPGLTFGTGNTAVITVNNGGACTQGSFMNVQADQF